MTGQWKGSVWKIFLFVMFLTVGMVFVGSSVSWALEGTEAGAKDGDETQMYEHAEEMTEEIDLSGIQDYLDGQELEKMGIPFGK